MSRRDVVSYTYRTLPAPVEGDRLEALERAGWEEYHRDPAVVCLRRKVPTPADRAPIRPAPGAEAES
jgi:hypothetical protein